MHRHRRAAFIVFGFAPSLVLSGPATSRGEVTVERVEFEGWANNFRIANGEAELIVTLDVGPRIISYRRLDGANVFKTYDDQLGSSGEAGWKIRGGHRLWVSPEDPDRTYVPDNQAVDREVIDGGVRVGLPPDPTHSLRKEMEITLADSGTEVTVRHRIRNDGREGTELAIWSLSVMKPGGIEVIPLPPNAPHPGGSADATAEDYAPLVSLALWSYTEFTDPRWTFGADAITLRQDPGTDRGPTKLGLSNRVGAAGYLNGGTAFIKRFPFDEGATYPDFGSNYETFTNAEMLEMETLGPLVRLGPGEHVEHVERWELVGGLGEATDHESATRTLLPLMTGN